MIRLPRSQRVFPVLLLILTGLLTVWLDQISSWDSTRRDLDPDKPEYVAEQLTATRFDIQGQLNQRLTASRMWQYPGKDDAFFETPELYQYQQGLLEYQLLGEVGRYNRKTQQAYFDKKATVIQIATASVPETKVITSAMHVDISKKIMRSTAPTQFYHGNSRGNSIGFIYQQPVGLLNLLSTTRIVYAQ
ncbi:LPS export ABC transporter periplasmic protein LptC [Neisseriaceae bacterium TC5R-5]|nr:LPS export ABC transporter periplasmic protein LptC [Neisseriaceae bacterium TC5R-5]